MDYLTNQVISCPYCGESIEVLIDYEEVGQQYIEDCHVCCQPMVLAVALDSAGNPVVSARDENEV